LLVWITRIWPNLLDLAQVVKPETILRWHRSGFKSFWRWKSRNRVEPADPLWGASRIHGELLMLGFEVAQSTVSKYLVCGGAPSSQTWKTFLRNNAQAIAAIDMCVGRRQLLWFEVTRHPTSEWLPRPTPEAVRTPSLASAYSGRVLAFTLILVHLGNVG
jgi:hypothetical protein